LTNPDIDAVADIGEPGKEIRKGLVFMSNEIIRRATAN